MLDKTRFRAVAATLSVDCWGLPEDVYRDLLANAELVIHVSSMRIYSDRVAETR